MAVVGVEPRWAGEAAERHRWVVVEEEMPIVQGGQATLELVEHSIADTWQHN